MKAMIKRNWEYIHNDNKENAKILRNKTVEPKWEDSKNIFDFSEISYKILS